VRYGNTTRYNTQGFVKVTKEWYHAIVSIFSQLEDTAVPSVSITCLRAGIVSTSLVVSHLWQYASDQIVIRSSTISILRWFTRYR